jgi:pyrimidine-specific ribonucleoside hydrolase
MLLLVFLFLCPISKGYSAPLPQQTKFEVIIDTDGAIDDMRAISLLLSRPEVTIKAILLSDGSLPPVESYSRIKALLKAFGADTIPVGSGSALKGVNPEWRKFNLGIDYGQGMVGASSSVPAKDLLTKILFENKERITMICLGTLTNLAQLYIENGGIAARIDRIIWYNEHGEPGQGFNYSADPKSAETIMKSGIKMVFISNLKNGNDIFDVSCMETCRTSKTTLASFLTGVYNQPEVLSLLQEGHFRLYDDLVVLYLLQPELFDMDISKASVWHRYDRGYNTEALRDVLTDIINGNYIKSQNIVFSAFPDHPEQFTYDVRQIMDSAIMLYGAEEWKANVMTDEFHGHLGVFSIVGAKMGTKAKDIFGVGNDQIEVVTFAGQKPPYSCLTDGIQVSTGATMGMGTIHLAADSIAAPMALFTYKGETIRMTLKQEYLEQVDADINEGIVKFGMADDGYWKLVRRNALRYWLEWDRNEIFTIEEIK